jgi:hypothetical protein
MDKEYLDYLKENDPIHYSEMMGDPVTGLHSNNDSSLGLIFIVLLLVGVGILIGALIFKQ